MCVRYKLDIILHVKKMSSVSSTDVKLFVALANPENTNTDLHVDDILSKVRPTQERTLTTIPERVKDEESSNDSDEKQSNDDDESNNDDDNESYSNTQSEDSGSEDSDSDEKQTAKAETVKQLASSSLPQASVASWKKANSVASSTKSSFSKRVEQHKRVEQPGSAASWGKASAYEPLPTLPSSTFRPNFTPSSALSPSLPADEPTLTKEEKEELMLEKQSVLLELERLKSQGIVLSKAYTLQDRVDDMQFEVRRHLLNIEEQNTVQFMRDGMRLAFTGVEIANSKLGPFLNLDGWAAEVGKDISKYDSSLSRLYRKYWKRSTMSPEMELAVGILGSMGMHHFKKQMGNVMGGVGGGAGGVLGGMMGGLGNFTKNAVKKRSSASATGASFDSSDDEEGLPASFQ